MKKNRVIYYKDELSDEFSSAQIKPISIDENYIYDRKTKGKILHFGIRLLPDLWHIFF